MSFTQDIFGSFVEFLNTVILMSLFSQEYFKNKIKLISSMIIVSVIIGILDLAEVPSVSIFIYIIILINLRIVTKRNIFNILFELIFATAITIAIEHVLVIVFYELQGENALEFINRCIQLFITFIICALISSNRKLKGRVQAFYAKYQEEFYLISVTLFCFSMIEVFLWKSNSELVFHQSAIISAYTAIWFCLCSFLLKKLIENRKQKENIRLHEQYMETTENLLDGLYSEKHDFNKHLQAIQSICQFEEASVAVAEIEMYIDELKTKELNKKKSTVSINTGSGVVNALLYSKTKEAEKHGVQFYYVPSGIFPDFPCEQYELVQILGNLLDNAFEYIDGLEKEERKVILSISEMENKKRIEVRNTYHIEKSRQASISQNKNCSTKSGERRGYGLQNVKTVILKYHGKFNIFQEENEFIVEVLF
ncbi:sensor histidine kinase [Aminipila terrae]|uniref:GHKL domain-containing protein n=1 Tax=Aminipila terrae TaxID=2697030 RepID=A0A6P1MD63_9FIRM|nr:GHKL domain-containing protein [Aminipila terrae]QHI71847.1 GHKL domain-containing protein [Aminipila terrae]